MEEYVKISIETYTNLKKKESEFDLVQSQLEETKKVADNKVGETVSDIIRFVLHIKDTITYSDIQSAATRSGFSIIYKNSIGTTTLGEGKRIYQLLSNNV